MSEFARLQWQWEPAAPLITGYSQNLAQAAGLIERGAPKVVNLQTRDEEGKHRPAFLATSVKGLFRTAAAWLVERVAHEAGATSFVTCDYALAVPERQRRRLSLPPRPGKLCPVCQLFGASGCLSGSEGVPAQRQRGHVNFTFNATNDATYGRAIDSPPYHWAWEQIERRGKPLLVEQLQFEPGTQLTAQVEPADAFSLALLWLAGDLISSGFFRFGRFTSRGYGVVRLHPSGYLWEDLSTLLSRSARPSLSEIIEDSGRSSAKKILGEDPLDIVEKEMRAWIAL